MVFYPPWSLSIFLHFVLQYDIFTNYLLINVSINTLIYQRCCYVFQSTNLFKSDSLTFQNKLLYLLQWKPLIMMMMKNSFYFILKALVVLKILNFCFDHGVLRVWFPQSWGHIPHLAHPHPPPPTRLSQIFPWDECRLLNLKWFVCFNCLLKNDNFSIKTSNE